MGIFDELNLPDARRLRPTGLRAEAEDYAANIGLHPGDPGWGDAIRNFVLKGARQFGDTQPLPIPSSDSDDDAGYQSGPASRSSAAQRRASPPARRRRAPPPSRPAEISETEREAMRIFLGGRPGEPRRDGSLAGRLYESEQEMMRGVLPSLQPSATARSRGQRGLLSGARGRTAQGGPPRFPRQLAALSEEFEGVQDRGPETISTGQNDPHGGKSYGRQQLSLKQGSLREFLQSDFGRPFRKELDKLALGSKEFDAKWVEIATRDPEALDEATFRFYENRHYRTAIAKVKREANIDLDALSNTVRAVTYSTAVQHGGWSDILLAAVRDVDGPNGTRDRDSSTYEAELIASIYKHRAKSFLENASPVRAKKMIDTRILPEQKRALEMWRLEHGILDPEL